MKRAITRFAAALLAGAALLLADSGCTSQGTTSPGVNSEQSIKMVKAFSGSVARSEAPIRVELAQGVGATEQALAQKAITLSPSVKGEATFLSPTLLEFTPKDGALRKGADYGVKVDLSTLYPGSSLPPFTFPLHIVTDEGALEYGRIVIGENDEVGIEGTVHLNFPADETTILKMLSASGKGKVTLGTPTDQYNFPFTVAVQRGTGGKNVTVELKGAPIAHPSSFTVNIPAKGDFRILDHKMVADKDPYVQVVFSDILSSGQDLSGLIELEPTGRTVVERDANIAKVYYSNPAAGPLTLTVSSSLSSASGTTLPDDFTEEIKMEDGKPAVVMPFPGTILPQDNDMKLPFKAMGLRAVDVKVIRVYEDNILRFLQNNELGGDSGMRAVGRMVYRKTHTLVPEDGGDLHKWNDFALDLGGLFKKEKGALYQVSISFRPQYSVYMKDIPTPDNMQAVSPISEEDEDTWDEPDPYYWDGYDFPIDWDNYSWNERDNPSNPAYYTRDGIFPKCNIISSDIGLSVKIGSAKNVIWVTSTDLITSKPLPGASITAYNYQLQPIGSATTDAEGLAQMELLGKPFAVVASKGDSKTYLKVIDGNEKSLSRFDTGGDALSEGMKGFIYGERGVWRPGDTLHLTMILQQKGTVLPEGLPVSLEVYTPQGRFHTSMTCATSVDGFYRFDVPTRTDDPTGAWNAYFKAGGASFHKSLRVETLKPNRLKIDLGTDRSTLLAGKEAIFHVASNYLSGPPAADLPAKIDLTLTRGNGTFPGFKEYTFTDPTRSFETGEYTLGSTTLDSEGKGTFNTDLPGAQGTPGMLTANILTTVTEKGGDASFTLQTYPYSPYSSYVGVALPQGDVRTGKDIEVKVIDVSPEGKALSGRKLEYRIYKLKWSWWWENAENLASYVNGYEAAPVNSGSFTSGTSPRNITFEVPDKDWGRYLVYVKDVESGHGSGGTLFIDNPDYMGASSSDDPSAVSMISFSSDKSGYETGETATVYIPAARDGHALVSLENGSSVISRKWVSTKEDGPTPFSVKLTPDMAPNVYVHVTLLQPHSSKANDLPIRMYGVLPLMVSNPASKLTPVITSADKVEPGEEFSVSVSEKNGKEMTYTLAIVDEGLLDISNFKTPDPWDFMYRREALGVRTFDMFDEVIGAYGGRFSSVLGIGGDESILLNQKKDNRFEPVVRFMGPYTLKKGSRSHKVNLPQYVGSVRVMVVAGHGLAFGNAKKEIQVSAPLMILPSLPASLNPGDKVTLPVNVFATEDGIGKVDVSVKTEGEVKVATGDGSASLNLPKQGEAMQHFSLLALGSGQSKVTVTATGGGHKAVQTINIPVQAPLGNTSEVESRMIAAGQTAQFTTAGKSTVELSTFPAVSFDALATKALNYGYDCTEQICARGITLVYALPYLSKEVEAKARECIPLLLSSLYSRQAADGGFMYWPNSSWTSTWVSSMAGEFMTAARDADFKVSTSVLSSWRKYQQSTVKSYRPSSDWPLDQAYRLYTLSLCGNADNAAMNRLREQKGGLDGATQCMLSAAYSIAGKKSEAQAVLTVPDLESGKAASENADRYYFYSYGRDEAIVLLAYALRGDIPSALESAARLASSLQGYYSTQEMAFGAAALRRLAEKTGTGAIDATISGGEKELSAVTASSTWKGDGTPAAGKLSVRNNSTSPLYATVISRTDGTKPVVAAANGLRISVRYVDASGAPVSPSGITQGESFRCIVSVQNPSKTKNLRDLALSLRIPAGWEVTAERMIEGAEGKDSRSNYQDIRDEGALYFFDLGAAATKTFTLPLRAAYLGEYILPSVSCEAMYEPRISARTASGTAVVKQ